VWNIPLAEFNDVNLSNIAKIAIGFGDWTSPGGEPNGYGLVYFEDIILRNGPAEDIYYDGSVYLDEDPFVNGYQNRPLLLKQDCRLIDAGGDYIDELRNLVGKTTAWKGFPDSNVVDIGFHYINWYYVNADLNQDGIVNFKDFAILANYWQQSTTEEADLDDSGFVDYSDVSILAGQWLWLTGPNIQLQIESDANDGFVEFGATGFTSDTQRIFLLMDGQYVGEIFGFRDGFPLGVDVSEFGGGEKQIKAVSIDSAGQVTCSNITSTEFSCPLNYCLLPSEYEPNKPLHFSAFNPSAEEITVKVYADCGNLVWSQDYNGVNFCDSIPAEITSQHEIDYIRFDKSGVWSLLKPVPPAPNPLEHDYQALIILPDYFLHYVRAEEIIAVRRAFLYRGIKCQILGPPSATFNKISLYAFYNPIKYIYILAHSGYGIDPKTGKYQFANGVLRTYVNLHEGTAVSVKLSDFDNPNDAPSWCKSLGYFWETRTTSFYSMRFTSLEFAYFDGCFSGRLRINSNDELIEGQPGQIGLFDIPHSDMSWALNMRSWDTQIYQGWYQTIPIWEPFFEPETGYLRWTRDEWERLGEGYSLYDALTYTIDHQTEYEDPNAPVNNYRIKGHGCIWELFLNDD
jgi:hypothetical protein